MIADQALAPSKAAETLKFAGRDIHFYGVWFLYEDEMQLKVDEGVERLWDLLVDGGVARRSTVDRPSVARSRGRARPFGRREN